MKCEKCGSEYPSQYYFETPTICRECFKNMSDEEKQFYLARYAPYPAEEWEIRIGFGKRFLAFFIDSLIITIIILFVYNATGFFDSATIFAEEIKEFATNPLAFEEVLEEFFEDNLSNFYFAYIISLAFFSLEIMVGASLGKLILGIQIADSNRRPASAAKLLKRYLIKHLVSIVSIVWLLTRISFINSFSSIVGVTIFIGYFFALSQKKQTFQDMIAGTAVFDKRDIINENINEEINQNVN
ncbi:MAG: RDD family protein [Ignavibacteria bacterium]|nr:RDD family protein [Ignavibacteria bacterium]